MSSQQDGNGSMSNSASSAASRPETRLDQAAGKAVEEYLPKAAKLKTAEQLLWMQDLQSLGATERSNVQRYIEEKVFRNGSSSQARPEAASTIIVCDNVYGDEAARKVFGGSTSEQTVATSIPSAPTANPQPSEPSLLSKAAPLLLAAALGGGLAGIPWLLSRDTAVPQQPSVIDTDTDTQYILELVPDDPTQ